MEYRMKSGTAVIRLTCAVLFLIFTFLYLFDYQGDILTVTQHILSKGQTHYDKTIGAVLITLVLWLVQVAVQALAKLNSFFHALTYLPSLLLLAILTDVSPRLGSEGYLGNWLWAFPLAMAGYAAVVWLCRQYETIHQQDKNIGQVRLLWINLLTLTLLFFLSCSLASNDRLFHHGMRMETCMLQGRYADALEVGAKDARTDSSLTFLRIWTLSRQHLLGEQLFEYPLVGQSDAMLPNGTSVRLMMVPEKLLYKDLGVVFTTKLRPMDYLTKLHANGWATRQSHDWLLCACLLDGDLDRFARLLPRFYNVDKPLPKHYREALTLYTHQRNAPLLVYHDEVMDADYEDYQALRRKHRHPRLQYTALRDSYGKTYWFYYYNLKTKGHRI